MATLRCSSIRLSAPKAQVQRAKLPAAAPRVRNVLARAQLKQQEQAAAQQEERSALFNRAMALSAACGTLLTSGNALAAQELAQVADSDGRLGILLTLFVPVVGWVLFNIAGPAFGQLDIMGDRAKDTPPESRSLRLKRSVAGALGLGAAGLLASAPAEAATELAQLADSDGRLGILLTLFVPVVGWVLFNIAGPAFSQLDIMGDRAKDTPPESRSLRVKRSVAGALGLGAAGLLASAPAEAATELAQLADSDGRLGILLTLFVPVVGWVLFNIAGPAFGQLGVMGDKAKDTPPEKRSFRSKRSVAGALGLGAAGLLAASAPAEAATELAQLADSDGRLGILLTLFVPVVGWVLFNIAGPAFGQLDIMGDRAKDTPPESRSLRLKRSVAGALGLGAAGLLASAPAEAATELAQLADSDGRLGILLTLFVPVVGWVLFNIAGPAFSQLDIMGDKAKDTPPSARSIRTK